MKAVGFTQNLPISDPLSLLDLDLPRPVLRDRDLLVQVQAISVNPVDTKIRRNRPVTAGEYQVLGWDVCGIVQEIGPAVSLFKPGDRVWYAGAIDRPGANSQWHAVDERIVALAPTSLSDPQAAALPLTGITAWELLFDRLQVSRSADAPAKTLLIVGAAGGVGSILVQLAAKLTSLTVIATASRPETQAWVKQLGAHHVIDHSKPLSQELKALGYPSVDLVASLTQTDQHVSELAVSIAPQGKLALIDDPTTFDIKLFKSKSVSIHWEFMYTRSMYQTADMQAQHELLTELAELVDKGVLKTTLGQHLGSINANNLRHAHTLLESGTTQGKLVLEGWRE
ncbi:zinc-binding alcohol dehydrogenase family protein [Alcaligenes endophyticus]|uniref:Zinc-type alcohol dehydrogenase-like protein n=1 Tax=Alcaligenes endophyticus TaxID=1929088 RepID=A0ABT8EJH0_9BURK|nr:zinc-binding alcohol dehydrogenase family protein [Alcaligenes endophyticus]MCX5591748.1 zinc-binding alcohol dehydrogenase family protein [Alcaligenes endophyticus]MDN4121425.1 zinc-binding alcohol dehydrogenase family protein [Alcaligenes endophyticus]